MLNTDIAMYFANNPNNDGLDQSSCKKGTRRCPEAPSADLVDRFIAEPQFFLSEFQSAFEILIELGGKELAPAT